MPQAKTTAKQILFFLQDALHSLTCIRMQGVARVGSRPSNPSFAFFSAGAQSHINKCSCQQVAAKRSQVVLSAPKSPPTLEPKSTRANLAGLGVAGILAAKVSEFEHGTSYPKRARNLEQRFMQLLLTMGDVSGLSTMPVMAVA